MGFGMGLVGGGGGVHLRVSLTDWTLNTQVGVGAEGGQSVKEFCTCVYVCARAQVCVCVCVCVHTRKNDWSSVNRTHGQSHIKMA